MLNFDGDDHGHDQRSHESRFPGPVADSGFSWPGGGGAPTPKVGVLTYNFAFFLPKTPRK